GLYAAGETACTGVHGANRLASNSLLEGLVFGARVAEVMREEPPRAASNNSRRESGKARGDADDIAQQLKQSMWQHAGVVRNREGLQQVLKQIADWKQKLGEGLDRMSIEIRNLLLVGEMIAQSALAREESRGAHFRSDFPKHDDVHFLNHSTLQRGRIT